MSNEQSIIFNCSPSLGILDVWLPVIVNLKEVLPNTEFIFFSPVPTTIDQIKLNTTLIEISNIIFSQIIFKSHSNNIISTASFEEAVKINRISKYNSYKFTQRVFNKLKLKSGSEIIDKISLFIGSFIFRKNIFDMNNLSLAKTTILFDVVEVNKSYNEILFNSISKESKKFSLLHGININGFRKETNEPSKKILDNLILYCYSDKEKTYYKDKYQINEEDVRSYGIPRHDKKWIDYLIKHDKSSFLFSDEDYIFVISRPLGATVSEKMKREYINDIKRISEKYDLKVVIKKHPRELHDVLFEEVLGKASFNKTWTYSESHPFVIGKKAKFAISFYSGVGVDTIILGTPTIERLNLSNVKAYINHPLRDNKNIPITELRYFGLVLGASCYEELDKHVEKVLENKIEVLENLKTSYLKNFSYIENINDKICNEITKEMNK